MSAEEIGSRIQERRTALGLRQRDLARPGVSGSYISRIEAGQRYPRERVIRYLASALAMSPHELVTGESDPAESLAKLVLAHQEARLPTRAFVLAQVIVDNHGGSSFDALA